VNRPAGFLYLRYRSRDPQWDNIRVASTNFGLESDCRISFGRHGQEKLLSFRMRMAVF
jgi:hypothetical protein